MKIKILLFAFLIISYTIKGQSINNDVIASAGDYFANANNSLAWTIGETVSETYSNSNNSLTQGFHQTGAGWDAVTITEISENTNNINIYPNPIRDELNIEFSKNGNYTIELFDITGQIIYQSQISNLKSQISLAKYSTGIYLLNIKSENNKLQSFRINKIN